MSYRGKAKKVEDLGEILEVSENGKVDLKRNVYHKKGILMIVVAIKGRIREDKEKKIESLYGRGKLYYYE